MPPSDVIQGGVVEAVVGARCVPKIVAMLRGCSRTGTRWSRVGNAAFVICVMVGVVCPTATTAAAKSNKIGRIGPGGMISYRTIRNAVQIWQMKVGEVALPLRATNSTLWPSPGCRGSTGRLRCVWSQPVRRGRCPGGVPAQLWHVCEKPWELEEKLISVFRRFAACFRRNQMFVQTELTPLTKERFPTGHPPSYRRSVASRPSRRQAYRS